MQITNNLKTQLQKILIQDEIEAISVVNPTIYEQNIKNFQKILEQNNLKYSIHSVLKVNHSNALLKTALKNGLRADVSSIGELEQAISVGFTGENITANGPKNKKFLQKAIEINSTICIDSIEELEKIVKIGKERNQKIKIIIRLGAFKTAQNTRFGIAKWLWNQTVNILVENKNILEVLGFHFHIDIPDVTTRIEVFWEAIDFWKILLKNNFSPKIIDIGGSFGTTYKNDISHNLVNKNETLGKNHKMYSVHEYSDEKFLKEFLERNPRNGKPSIWQFIRENDITLWIEPGRSLLSHNVGFVATSIIGTREDSLIINSNSFGLGMREEELPTNPILIDDIEDKKEKIPYWILGNLCLESDMVYSRSIPFGREVEEDDILIFPNMAAYHMDFYETESIAHPKKIKFFIDENQILQKDIL